MSAQTVRAVLLGLAKVRKGIISEGEARRQLIAI
ncbi:MAG: hypothetical protein JWM91_604 [Rhodospirillales bacterium]|nr:hypothetical protein [Rhodospirillales bacterium]